MAQMAKNLPSNAGEPGSIPGLGRSPRGGHGYLFQYSCLENPVDRGAWRSIVHGVAKSQTRLSDLGPSASRYEKASLVARSLRRSHTAAIPKGWLSNPSSVTQDALLFPCEPPTSEGLRLCHLHFCHLSPKGPARKAEPVKETGKHSLLVLGCGASPGGRISLKAYLASLVAAWASPST